MHALIEKETNTGQKLYYKVTGIKSAVFFDNLKERIMIDGKCTARTPVRPENVDIYVELE